MSPYDYIIAIALHSGMFLVFYGDVNDPSGWLFKAAFATTAEADDFIERQDWGAEYKAFVEALNTPTETTS